MVGDETLLDQRALHQRAIHQRAICTDHQEALITSNEAIAYCFHAFSLDLVMGPAAPVTSVKISGADRWTATGRGARKYYRRPRRRQHGPKASEPADPTTDTIADRQFEIEFLGPGVEAFAFTLTA